ncbi:hypothetical protein F511_19642 [Dorcoceras hygrometricum]|uniref:Uncharacterized protein n=1 Tax=Dorcoceras hygrometricum TaxID=472368 RepID=A0A2Z7C1K3_9LAMI|nr:hypothetical protein F511_19642 [Dorcoceras hygrometricum]
MKSRCLPPSPLYTRRLAPPPPRVAGIRSGQFDEENPFVHNSSVLLVQADEGVSVLVVDRIGDIYRSLPRRVDVILTTVGARHKCQQDASTQLSDRYLDVDSKGYAISLWFIFSSWVSTSEASVFSSWLSTSEASIFSSWVSTSEEFPASKILTDKTIHRYITVNDKIEVEDVSQVKKTPVKRAVSRKRPAVVDKPVVKKKRTCVGKVSAVTASPSLEAVPIQTVAPISTIPPSAPKRKIQKRKRRLALGSADESVMPRIIKKRISREERTSGGATTGSGRYYLDARSAARR